MRSLLVAAAGLEALRVRRALGARATVGLADLWGDEGPGLARPTRLSSGTHGALPAVAVPAGGRGSGPVARASRDSGSVARRQRATSPSPSVCPLMAADGPKQT
jgi:hypothetical protein